jgi:hypothetical protein
VSRSRPRGHSVPRTLRDLATLVGAFAATTAIAAALGAANFGTALGIGVLAFTVTLMWILLTER